MARNRILIVDDEVGIRFGVRDFLRSGGYEVVEAASCREALEHFQSACPDAAIIDYQLPDGTALELLPNLKGTSPETPVIVLTGHGSIDLAVRAIKEGADHFLTKPVALPALLTILERLLENQRTRQKQLAGRTRQARKVLDPFIGASTAIRQLAEQAQRIAATERPVLIQGETGSGKGVLARWLHNNSPRAEETFVDLNCAGLAREFLETELFGHEKGAFTGAIASKMGLLEVAHRGTVFLDEIGDMDQAVQPAMLKVLEDRRFRRLGEVRDREVDIRLIAATHQDLSLLVREKKFRSDLYYRISTIPLHLPPLRERREDIPLIARQLLTSLAAELGRGQIELEVPAVRALQSYSWPGNIRELRNVLEHAVILSDRNSITPQDLRFAILRDESGASYDTALSLLEVEKRHIARVLQEEGGHVERAAARLGIPRSSLYQKLRKFQIV
ncbi:MAG TPA: sigma-54 dependent transcriptional regulator [Blastocatellia bacterium]|nr:sigma-54 dependent transcriptional regulator [Blastocatellia bacterium]